MDILIPHSWLKDFLKTEATPQKIAECLSLCGPSVEKVEKQGKDYIYSIEVTTNRVDSAGVYGIAREAAAILPRFGVKAALQAIKVHSAQYTVHRVSWLDVTVDQKLCPRFTAILIKNIQLKKSSVWMEQRLKLIGLRPINNVVDISNYLMHELGQPLHTFDYDKIKNVRMILRQSRAGEEIITLDGKLHKLPGKDIVIEDGEGRIIDLAGIMGGANSAVSKNTKNVLLFVQTYNPVNIRKTSMAIAKRSEAASLFEKGLDSELVETTIRRAIDLFVKLANGNPENEILDIYPNPYKEKLIDIGEEFINERLGTKISKSQVAEILISLGFRISWKDGSAGSPQGGSASVGVPSFRANDIDIPEDIVEEVARIYGYHKLPSILMPGVIPTPLEDSPFGFETKVKNLLKGWGGVEVYTLSLVSKEKVSLTGPSSWALKLKNPLGSDSAYLRQSLCPSLVDAVLQNSGEKEPFHLFEMSNIYLPVRGRLPEERMILSGIFANYEYRSTKGVLEALLKELRSSVELAPEDARGFLPNQRLAVKAKKEIIGQFGTLEKGPASPESRASRGGYIYYELDVELLRKTSSPNPSYISLPKYPAQIEDLGLLFPERVRVGEVIEVIKSTDKQIVSVELIDVYENTKTFRVEYQNPNKTLVNKEVEKLRKRILQKIKKRFGVNLKD